MTTGPAYFDTSVLVKTYVLEEGSARACQLIRSRSVITSSIAGLELMSAFRQNLASGSLDDRTHSVIVRRFQQHRQRFRYVEVTAAILETAERYVSEFNVQALDAIHIASATVSRVRFPKDLAFITADSRQKHVAEQTGLLVIWVAG